MQIEGDDENLTISVLEDSILIGWATEIITSARSASLAAPGSLIATRFGTVLHSLSEIVLDDTLDGSFDIVGGVLKLQPRFIQKTLNFVISELARDENGIAPSEYMIVCKDVFCVYLLHELRHVEQGIGKYSTIRQLKEFRFAEIIAEFDLLADRDAASAFAILKSDNDDQIAYLEHFQEALFFSAQYFFRTFEFSKRRPHKVLRSVGLILMLGRLIETSGNHGLDYAIPLDSTISLQGLDLTGPYILLAEQPAKKLALITTALQADEIGEIIEAIEDNDFNLALGLGSRFARHFVDLAA